MRTQKLIHLSILIACSPLFTCGTYAGVLDDMLEYQKAYIDGLQMSNGAYMMGTPASDGSSKIVPYLSNFGAKALLKSNPTLYQNDVKSYIDWYFQHLNTPDLTGQHGTVYDYAVSYGVEGASYDDYDSADSYAATFLSLLRTYHETTGDDSIFTSDPLRKGYITTIAEVMSDLQDPTTRLTIAKSDYAIQYLMNNAEVYQGFQDASYIFSTIYSEPAIALTYENKALEVASGIETYLSDVSSATYDPYYGSPDANLATWYPDALVQVFPALFGLPNDCSRYDQFVQNFPDWTSVSHGDGRFPMAFLMVNAYKCGDYTSIGNYLENIEDSFGTSEFIWPWNISEASWTIEAILLCQSNPTCTTQVESAAFIDQVIYTPALQISLTGTTDDLSFAVKESIVDAGALASNPYLNSTTRKFSGGFYIENIGWGLLQTGTYQVGIDCGTQSLSTLRDDCRLTGSGWGELIGELGFSGIVFDPITGTLSGVVTSNIGDLDITGISLALKPSILDNGFFGASAYHDYDVSIMNRGSYPDGVWDLLIETTRNIYPRTFISDNAGEFSNIDLSYSDEYRFTLRDPDGGNTRWEAQILPEGFSLSLTPGSHFIQDYCNLYPTSCPDGASLSAADFTKVGDNLVADGTDKYEMTFRPRDSYGNSIQTGSISILYTATVNTNQLDQDGSTLSPLIYLPGIPGSSVIVEGDVLTNMLDGTLVATEIPLVGQDLTYSIKSSAPTNAQNVIKLENITYHAPTGLETELTGIDSDPLVFRPWFDASTNTDVSEIQVSESHGFDVTVTNNSTRVDTTPYIFTFFSIGQNALAAWRDFTSDETISCQAYAQELTLYSGQCDWGIIRSYVTPSVVVTHTLNSFTLTGVYAPMSRYPIKESVISENIIAYTGLDTFGIATPIIYSSDTNSYGTSEYRASNLKILGVNNALAEYGDLSVEGTTKSKLFDTIRKNIALLSRNRTHYDDVDYTIINGSDMTLTGGSFDTKRSIFVVGGNVTISENTLSHEKPLALISLADEDGNGGVITIDPSVTDLHLIIITNRHITTSGDKQLYIHGSIISSNTLGDTTAMICPDYTSSPCDATEAAKYDLENMRASYSLLADKTGKGVLSPLGTTYPQSAIILEQDTRLISNPPPGLSERY